MVLKMIRFPWKERKKERRRGKKKKRLVILISRVSRKKIKRQKGYLTLIFKISFLFKLLHI